MLILGEKLHLDELKRMAADTFGDMVKAVVDARQELVAIDAELHADLEALLLERGSLPQDLWGVNLYPFLETSDFLEFDSMINMRPAQGNMSRAVEHEATRKRIAEIVDRWITR